MFSDAYEEAVERDHFGRPPNGDDRLMASIINFIRRTNITVSPPAHIKPTVWSTAVDLSARLNLAGGVGPYQTVVSFTAEPGRWARIHGFGVEVQDAAFPYDGSILWRLRKNGRPLGDGLSDWGIQRGSVVIPRETFIILEEDDTVDFQVRRAVAGAAVDVDMALTGWTWRLRNNFEGTAGSVTAF